MGLCGVGGSWGCGVGGIGLVGAGVWDLSAGEGGEGGEVICGLRLGWCDRRGLGGVGGMVGVMMG